MYSMHLVLCARTRRLASQLVDQCGPPLTDSGCLLWPVAPGTTQRWRRGNRVCSGSLLIRIVKTQTARTCSSLNIQSILLPIAKFAQVLIREDCLHGTGPPAHQETSLPQSDFSLGTGLASLRQFSRSRPRTLPLGGSPVWLPVQIPHHPKSDK